MEETGQTVRRHVLTFQMQWQVLFPENFIIQDILQHSNILCVKTSQF